MTHQYGNSGNDVAICRVGNIPEHGTALYIKVDSTLIFEKKIMEGGPYKYPIKIYQGRQSFAHLGFQSKVLAGPLND
jgi:predicted Rdx family selenoprotein